MIPNRCFEQRLPVIFWIARMHRLWAMIFAIPPDERRRRYHLPMPSMWLTLLASAFFLIVLMGMLFLLLTTLAG